MQKKISILIPIYNEEGNIVTITNALHKVLMPLPYNYEIIFVDDGSEDNSLNEIKELTQQQSNIFFISFSKNFGHQNAIKAGFDMVTGECVISMDGDMQHPPTLIPLLLKKWEEGYDIVYTIRKDHMEMPILKRRTSEMFYNVMNKLSDIELESGTADFRLMDKSVISVAKNFQEDDLFWRGLIKWMGFSQIGIEYEPAQRLKGKSKYTFKKMLQFALRGITSFSIKPLGIAIYLGFLFALLSLLYVPYVLYSVYFGHPISGWASLIVTIVFFGGLQLMILGIIGMYLGKLFMQSKQRPHYIIKETNLK
ncbi:MAG: glycosyltransferase family 2 protein [Bacteroidetes bacterium]|nr:glycosyltransferase family 2 protein [Bacteroidota bacterium]MBS1648495.1 glycosyltransferase family 2 protein [Bacteroidota bacterium]